MEGSPPFTCVSMVNYTCNEGYWLLGAETHKCGTDGQWDHAKPMCVDNGKKYMQRVQYIFVLLIPTKNSKQMSVISGGFRTFMCQPIIFQIFCRKLHENERIWTLGGVPCAPLDLPMLIILINKLYIKFKCIGVYEGFRTSV